MSEDLYRSLNRRHFLSRSSTGIGVAALSSLLGLSCTADTQDQPVSSGGIEGVLDGPHFTPTARRIIYLFQSGAPSQFELFDYKPLLREMHGEDLPESVRDGQRLTGMTANQERFPLVGTYFDFEQHGQSQAWVSELLPHTARIADRLCFIKSLHTEAINHDPAITFFPNRSPAARQTQLWIMALVRTRQRNREPACLHRPPVARIRPTKRATPVLAPLG